MIPFEKRRATRLYKQTRLGKYDNAKSVLFLGSHETFANLVVKCARERLNFCLIEFEVPRAKLPDPFMLLRERKNKNHPMIKESRLAKLALRRVPLTLLNPINLIEYLHKINFSPDYIYIAHDSKELIDLEFTLNSYYKCYTEYDETTKNFFTFKSYQNKICLENNIPVPNESGEYISVKRDYKSSVDKKDYLKFIKRHNTYTPSKMEFSQEFVDIEYILNVDTYVDENSDWYIFRIAKLVCENSIAYFSFDPFTPSDKEMSEIYQIVKNLSTALKIKKRLNMMQLMRCRATQRLMFMEFNPRPSSEYAYVRSWDRSTYHPTHLLLPDVELPTVFHFERLRRNGTFWSSYKDRFTNENLVNVPIRVDFSNNDEILSDVVENGEMVIHKV